ncbi:uncharacterized protein LOC143268949 [Peromyscus maniculatus bairdii]|uniref:uncharacterized protein LOC143268949 n=1 Tax=Peromyscus maniculatus bairdii TaxID=230844 RepID=UPI003FD15036
MAHRCDVSDSCSGGLLPCPSCSGLSYWSMSPGHRLLKSYLAVALQPFLLKAASEIYGSAQYLVTLGVTQNKPDWIICAVMRQPLPVLSVWGSASGTLYRGLSDLRLPTPLFSFAQPPGPLRTAHWLTRWTPGGSSGCTP